jgi:hypothetical protein
VPFLGSPIQKCSKKKGKDVHSKIPFSNPGMKLSHRYAGCRASCSNSLLRDTNTTNSFQSPISFRRVPISSPLAFTVFRLSRLCLHSCVNRLNGRMLVFDIIRRITHERSSCGCGLSDSVLTIHLTNSVETHFIPSKQQYAGVNFLSF